MSKGFTLIELMIVVAILAILVTIAYPSYQGYIQRGNREDAKAQVMAIMQAQSRYYAQNLSYTDTLANIGFPVAGGAQSAGNSSYSLTVAGGANCNNNCAVSVTISAVPVAGGNADPACGTLSFDSLGGSNATGAAGVAGCW